MMLYFIEHERLVHGKTKIQASWRPLLDGYIPLKIQYSVCAQQLVRSWQDALSIFRRAPSRNWHICDSSQNKIIFFPIVALKSKREIEILVQSLFGLGIVKLGDVVDPEYQRLSNFEDAKLWLCIPSKDLFGRNYKIYHFCMDLYTRKQMVVLGRIGS